MPIHSEIDPIGRLVHTRIVRPLTGADLRQHVGAVAQETIHDYRELIDLRELGPMQITSKELLEAVHQAREMADGRSLARRAFVVSDDDGFMMARTFAALVAGWVRVGVFEDPRAAKSWLDGPSQLDR
jgi:hypothetical protein